MPWWERRMLTEGLDQELREEAEDDEGEVRYHDATEGPVAGFSYEAV